MGALLRRWRTVLLWAAIVRVAVGVIAVLLAPLLYERHFVWVVLLRPTKEVRRGDVSLLAVAVAAVPLAVGAVWLMYALGIAYRRELRAADLPGLARRLIPPERIKRLSDSLEEGGARVVFVGRLAIFPSSLLAAAAGASGIPPRRFLLADGAGAIVGIAEVMAAGYLLGEAYEQAGPWLTVVGGLALVALLLLVRQRLVSRPGRRR